MIFDDKDYLFMEQALKAAGQSYKIGETPVGAVIVRDNEIISVGYNRRETGKNALYHAEIDAIDKACKALGGWRLIGCTMYVTLEPCPMCAGAIINSRIERVVYGAEDYKAGSFGSIVNLADFPYNHHPQVSGGLCKEESLLLLQNFFAQLRKNKKKNKDVDNGKD